MLETPSSEERAWLTEQLAELIARCGHGPFLCAPVIDDGPQNFPDPPRRGAAGVQLVARRLLWHAGLHDLRARVRDLRGRMIPGHQQQLADTDAWFAQVNDQVVEFELAALGNDDIIGILSHEVGVAFRALRQLDQRGGHPFRSAWEPALGEGPDEGADEQRQRSVLGSVGSVYLGLGLLATNASHAARHAGQVSGNFHSVEWAHTSAGGLPPQAMSFLCAVHAVIRDDETLYDGLADNQRKDYRAWYAHLRDQRAALAEQLGLPPEADWPEATAAPSPAPFDDEHYDAAGALAAAERRRFNHDRPVFFVPKPRSPAKLIGGLSGVGAFALVASLGHVVTGVVVGALCVLAGFALSRGERRGYCSDPQCGATLSEEDRVCPRCGGTISGEIAHPSHRLAAEEALLTEGDDAGDESEVEGDIVGQSDEHTPGEDEGPMRSAGAP